jgi:sugar O-acyltransferase (sialic acid O-acetyltransferase NeuD family)
MSIFARSDILFIGLDPELISLAPRFSSIGYIAPKKNSRYPELMYLGTDEEISKLSDKYRIYFGFDRPHHREVLARVLPAPSKPLISKNSILDKCEIGPGCTIGQFVYIGPRVKMGQFVKVNSRSSIHHDSEIGDFCVIAPSVTICGNVNLGDKVFIGAGATVLPGIRIADGAVIGAGSVVVSDILDGKTYAGVPAKVLH